MACSSLRVPSARRPRTPARLRLAGRRGRRQHQPQPQLHSCSSPTCPAFSVLALKVIDSSMVSVSPDVDREGRLAGDRQHATVPQLDCAQLGVDQSESLQSVRSARSLCACVSAYAVAAVHVTAWPDPQQKARVLIPTRVARLLASSSCVKTFVLIHGHRPDECSVAYAAWSGFDSPLRGKKVQSTCARYTSRQPPDVDGRVAGHEIWWTAQAQGSVAALAQLPPYVRARTQAREVSEITIA
jgi:hypothetical protein